MINGQSKKSHNSSGSKVEDKLKAMLVDSWYDAYLGVVILVRVIDGSIKKGMEVKFHRRKFQKISL